MSEREAMSRKVAAYHNEQARGASFEWHARCATHVVNQERIIKALADALEIARTRHRSLPEGRSPMHPHDLVVIDDALRLAGRLP